MDDRWCDELDRQVRALEACSALAPALDPEAAAATREAAADRLRSLAGEARRAVVQPQRAAAAR